MNAIKVDYMNGPLTKPVIAFAVSAFEPSERLIELVNSLNFLFNANQVISNGRTAPKIVIVDDGSSVGHETVFESAAQLPNCVLLRHAVNLGKGRALKTAINHCLANYSNLAGIVTLDADGQHLPADAIKCAEALLKHPNNLVLGIRNFDTQNIPFKSRLGNKLTRAVFNYLCGVKVSDTQTGLRGLPAAFLPALTTVTGERFEYETNMLIECKKRAIPIHEVTIETVYIEGNKSTHFNPLKDSFRIYAIFLKYLLSSTSAFVIDLLLFYFLVCILKEDFPHGYVMLATVGARVVSSLYNFYVNRAFVFGSPKSPASFYKYYLLAFFQMALSGFLVSVLTFAFPLFEVAYKIIVDTSLFFASFWLQRIWVFASKGSPKRGI
jgi:glycosyltransferase involved in cell wall biosynthesis